MRSEKIAIDNELQKQVDEASYVFIVEYGGMNVSQVNSLRRELRKEQAGFRVFKNSFMRRAAAQRNWPTSVSDEFKGMVAVVVGDDPVAAARSLKRFSDANKTPVVRGGMIADQPLTAGDITALASLPSREQLLSQLVGVLAAPMSGLVGVLNASAAQLVRVLKAIEEKKNAA